MGKQEFLGFFINRKGSMKTFWLIVAGFALIVPSGLPLWPRIPGLLIVGIALAASWKLSQKPSDLFLAVLTSGMMFLLFGLGSLIMTLFDPGPEGLSFAMLVLFIAIYGVLWDLKNPEGEALKYVLETLRNRRKS